MQKDTSIDQKNETIERSSLGRVLRLGDLYDARKDAAVGVNIFNGPLPETLIDSTDYPDLDVDYEITDRISEKFNKLSVNAELRLSVLAGMVNLQGSGKYLKEDKKSFKAGKMTLLYSIMTKLETISISNLELKKIIDLKIFDSFEATHIVVGIHWGANCAIISEYANQENKKQTEVEGLLKAEADKITYSIKGEGKGNYEDRDNECTENFTFRCHCDVVTDEELPTTLPQVVDFVKKLPKLVGKENNGKGKPLTYTLLPISSVIAYFDYEKKVDFVLKQLKEDSVLRFVHLFQEISLVRQQIYDFHQDVQLNSSYLSDQEFQAVTKLQNDFAITETSLRYELAETLVDVRSGKIEASKLDALIKEFEEKEFSPVKVQGYLHSLSDLSKKIKFIDNLLKIGADYIGKSESLENLIWSNDNPEIYVLFFAWSQREEKSYWKNIKHFFSLIKDDGKENSNHKFIVVDSDLQQEYASNGTVIHHYIDGELDCEDVLVKKIADEQLRKEKELEAQSQQKLLEKQKLNKLLQAEEATFQQKLLEEQQSTKAWGLIYTVDLVMCIDGTGSMGKLIEQVKSNALTFCEQLEVKMKERTQKLYQLRAKVIVFRDYWADSVDLAMQSSKFFNLRTQSSEFANFVSGITASGGGDEPENGLEALALALQSDWEKSQDFAKQRRFVVVYTDASAHSLEKGSKPSHYPKDIPKTFDELTDYWHDMPTTSKRLLLFAPDVFPWVVMDSWENTIYYRSKAGEGLTEFEMDEILNVICDMMEI
jgi:hypothetical protein